MHLILLFFLVFLIAILSTFLWLQLAKKFLWIDRPNQRSSHVVPTPKSGGAGFVLGFTFFTLVLYVWQLITLNELLLCSVGLLMALTGFIDDILNLSLGIRIGVQLFVSCAMVALLPILPTIPLFGNLELSSVWIVVFVVIAMVWLVNLYNFMDGIDALAASEAIFFTLALAWFALPAISASISLLALGLAVALSGFIFFNLPPARIFMGDLGSNYLGYVLGVLGLLGIINNIINIWTILVLLGVFIVDSSFTLVGRMRAGLVWYHAHCSHAYQHAARNYASHGKVVVAVGVINIVWLLPLAWLTILYPEAGLPITLAAWMPLVMLGRFCKLQQVQNPTVETEFKIANDSDSGRIKDE